MRRLARLGKLLLTMTIALSTLSRASLPRKVVAQPPNPQTSPQTNSQDQSEAKSLAPPLINAPLPSKPLPPAAAKVTRYAKRLLANYDTDHSGQLSKQQWSRMHGRPALYDRNQDGEVTLKELLLHIVEYGRYRRLGSTTTHQTLPRDVELTGGLSESVTGSPPSSSAPFHVSGSSLPTALPGWFRQKDSNGDGQLSMAEYAPTSNRDTVASFQRLDANRDGLLTPKECIHPVKSESDRPATDGLK